MKNVGQIPWNVTPIFETYKISCLMGRHLMRGDSENHSKGQSSHLCNGPNITLISAKDLSRLHQFGKKVLPGTIPWLCIVRGRNLERRHLGRRHWAIGKDERIRNLAKEVLTQMNGQKHCIFPVADGTVKLSGGDQVLRTSTLIRDRPTPRRRTRKYSNSSRWSDGSSLPPFEEGDRWS